MRDENKTKKQLIEELDRLRLRIVELEASQTEDKKIEEQLRVSEAKFRNLVENAPVGIAVVTPDGNALERNKALQQMYGYDSKEEFMSSPASERYYNPDDRGRFLEALRKGPVSDLQVQMKRKDGTPFWASLSSVPQLSDTREQQIITLIQDITERKKAEEGLRLQAEILDSATDTIYLRKLDGPIVYVNDTMSKMYGYSREELVGMDVRRLLAPERLAVFGDRISEAREKGEVVFESNHRRKDGVLFPVEVHFRVIASGGKEYVLNVVRDMTRRKEREEKLREAEARYRTLFEQSPDGVLLIDPETAALTEFNDAAFRHLGYTREEMSHMRIFDFEVIEHPEETRQRVAKILTQGQDEFITKHRAKGGDIRDVAVSVKTVEVSGRKLMLAIFRDITEQKRNEEALRASEEKFRNLVENAPVGIGITTLDGKPLLRNRAIQQMHGYSAEEILKVSVSSHYKNPEDREHFLKLVRQGPVRHFEAEMKRKDGTTFWTSNTAILHKTEEGAGFITIVQDITERKKTEEALRASEAKFRTLVENAPVGITISTVDGRNILCNKALQEIYGYPSMEEFVKVPTRERYYDMRDRERMLDLLNLGMVKDFEVQLKRKDGTPFWASLTSIPYALESGEDALITVTQDISERKRAQQDLEKLYRQEADLHQQMEAEIKRRANFMRALVHELKTPLTPVLASSDLLLEELKEGPYVALAKNIYQGAMNLNSRIDELLDLARGEVGMLRLKLEPLAPAMLLRETVDSMLPSASSKSLTLSLEIPSTLPVIQGDIQRLRQVLMNLIGNSIKFTDTGGTIIVRARKESAQIVVEVEDTGQGMTEEEQGRLFQPYHRLEEDREHMTGLGLGLVLCKMFVELHGGQISVRSKKGIGSTFSFCLPVQERGEKEPDKAGDKP